MNKRLFNGIAIVAMLAMALSLAGTVWANPGGNGGTNSDATVSAPRVDKSTAIVQLKGDPLSTYTKTKPAQGKKIDFGGSNVKSYRAQLSAQRNEFKKWLQVNAPKAQITGQFEISLNAVSVALNGTDLAKIASAPMVVRAEYEGLYYPTVDEVVDPDLALISAFDAWDEGGGGEYAGEGIKVAIIDTGIDITHPCFTDDGYPDQTQLGDTDFTNNKVIVAKVFNNKTPSMHYTAEALQEHGTHVAGTVACNYDTAASVDGVEIPHGVSGVAPRALLGNYNIFPGDVLNARSEDILNALEAAYADGFDVANLSLGGGASGIQDLLTIAVDNLDMADMVVAVAAGNSGPNYFTVESPGSAKRALTAGAATVGHFIGTPITVDGIEAAGLAGDFATVSSDLTAPLAVIPGTGVDGLNTVCAALPAGSLDGQIALLARGVCSFSTKIRFAQQAGAAAVLVVNSFAGDPIVMGSDGTADQPTVPAYNVSITDGAKLALHNAENTTISAEPAYLVTGNDDFMASFSSAGPTDVDFRIKPDVVAPGVNVLSSIPHQFCAEPPCFAFFQGTSMATPHLAGSAAVVLWLHPDWTAAEVRSAIVNTADQDVLKQSSSTALEQSVNIIGAGRENLFSAVQAMVALDPVSISFGAVPSGSGQTLTFDVTLTNLTESMQTFWVEVGPGDASVAYSVSPETIELDAGASGVVTVTMTAMKGAAVGFHQEILRAGIGDVEVAHAAVFTLIK